MGAFDGLYDDILNGKGNRGAIPDNAERSFSGELVSGLKAGVAVELPKMIGQAMKAVSDPGGGVHDFGQGLVEGAEERYKADPAAYAKSAYGADKSDYNPLKYVYDAASMTPASIAGATAAIPLAVAGAPGAVVAGAGMLASGGLFGASQYQDTYERAKEAGLSEEKAKAAGGWTGGIEGVSEGVANMIPGSFIAKPFAKLIGKGAARAAERGIVSSILGVKPFAKGLGKATLKELPVEMGTEFGQGAMQAQIEKDAGIRPDADWYQEGLQGAMAASMMTGGHMAAAGAGGAVKHHMTMNALTNPDTHPESRLKALETVGQRIDEIDPTKGAWWRRNGVNAIRDGKPIPLDDTFLSDLTPRAIPVEDVDLLEWRPGGQNYPVEVIPSGPGNDGGDGGGAVPSVYNPGTGFTMRDPGYIDAEFKDIGPPTQVPGQQRLALPLLQNDREALDNWFSQRGGLQNLSPEDQSLLDAMVAGRYGGAATNSVPDYSALMPGIGGGAIPSNPLGLAPGLETAHDAASSPLNDLPSPTDGQKEAGNYKKGHVNIQGLDISIENPAGSVRSGKDADGTPWSTAMQHHYGYIKGTVGRDKDHIDTFVGNNPESGKVFVVDQIDPKTGKFDGHKIMLGFDSQDAATLGYLRNYDDSGPSRVGAVTEMSMQDFKTWLKEGNTKKAVGQLKERADVEEGEEGVLPGETGAKSADNSKAYTEEVPESSVSNVDGREGDGVPDLQLPNVEELNGHGITHDVNSTGETIVMRDGKNSARRDKDGTWSVFEGGMKTSDMKVNELSMREAMDELIAMREPVADKESEAPGTDSGNTATGEELTFDVAGTDRDGNEVTYQVKARDAQEAMQKADEEHAVFDSTTATEVSGEAPVQPQKVEPGPSSTPTPAPASDFGKNNTMFTEDKAKKARELLRKKLSQVNAGLDPEIVQAGIDLAGYYIEGGARKFVAYAKKMIEDLGDAVKPYLKSWYSAVRFHPGFDTQGMDSLADLENIDIDKALAETETADGVIGDINDIEQHIPQIAERILPMLRAEEDFSGKLTRLAASWYGVKLADVLTGKRVKVLQEAAELAVVQRAREIASDKGMDADAKFEAIKRLYAIQPNLSERTSTSMQNQAYSTPAPVAFAMQEYLDLFENERTATYEPTAGTGMLVYGAHPDYVAVNEIGKDRLTTLEAQGFVGITEDDGRTHIANNGLEGAYERVVANPPFGKADTVTVDGFPLSKIEHQIMADALSGMRDDGKAAFIIGGHNFKDGQMSSTDRIFLNWLYSHYNVTHNIDVNGDVYSKQGTKFPIRVITVDGRKPVADNNYAPKKDEAGAYQTASTVDELRAILKGGINDESERGTEGTVPEVSGTAPGGREGGLPGRNSEQDNGNVGGDGRTVSDNGKGTGEQDQRTADNGGETGTGAELAPGNGQTRPVGGNTGVPGGTNGRVEQPKVESNENQVPYEPMSKGSSGFTLVPKNAAEGLKAALERVAEENGGDIDEFVRRELQYDSIEKLYEAFAAEQIDALAMSLHNMKNGKGMIIGDMTGIGKGRVVAGIIRHTLLNGKTPIFVTEKPKLFSDMWRDITDIGADSDVNPLIMASTNEGNIVDSQGKVLLRRDGGTAKGRVLYQEIVAKGKDALQSAGKNAVFVTYSQFNLAGVQRQVMAALASDSVIILDEAHNAGGADAVVTQKNPNAVSTAQFIRSDEVLGAASGVVYSSATFAKRPDNMPLYFRTALGTSGMSVDQLIGVMKRGGVALQQFVSAALTKAGGMIRREQDFSKIARFERKVILEDKQRVYDRSDTITEQLRWMLEFSGDMADNFPWADVATENGQEVRAGEDGSNVNSTEFASGIHNLIAQIQLSLKADAVVNEALTAIKEGYKPVIGLMNTMGSFLSDYATIANLKKGDEADFTFNDVLVKMLNNALRYTLENAQGNKTHHYVTEEQLERHAPELFQEYQQIKDRLLGLNLRDMPASPIDYIKQKISEAGYVVQEITGRTMVISPNEDGVNVLSDRDDKDRNAAVNGFNDGTIHALIINRAGATGLSLHPTVKTKDKNPRRMIIAQADLNIDTFVQMLGRIFRKGQLHGPEYIMLSTALPSETRPAIVVERKMQSMNANTSANDKSGFSSDIPDMVNQYGDQVVKNWLRNNFAFAGALGVDPESQGAHGEMFKKVSGRMGLMAAADQETFWSEVVSDYKTLIAEKDALGQNDLVTKDYDFKAKLKRRVVIHQGTDETNPFTASAVVEEVSVINQGKPYTAAEIQERIDRVMDGKSPEEYRAALIAEQVARAEEFMRVQQAIIDESARAELDENGEIKDVKIRRRRMSAQTAQEAVRNNLQTFRTLVSVVQLGKGYDLNVDSESNSTILAVPYDIRIENNGTGNPLAPSKIKIMYAIPNGQRSIPIGMNRQEVWNVISRGRSFDLKIDWDGVATGEARQTRYIITGNILQGYNALDSKAQLINFTREDGTRDQGILVPLSANIDRLISRETATAERAAEFIEGFDGRSARDSGNDIAVVRVGNVVSIRVPGARQRGGKFFLDPALLNITGDFRKSRGYMNVTIPLGRIREALTRLEELGARFIIERVEQAGQVSMSLGGGVRRKLNPSSLSRIKSAIERILPPGVKLELAEKLEYDLDQVEAGAKAHGIDLVAIKASGKRYKVRARGSAQTVRLSTGELTSLIKLSMQLAGEETGYHEILHAAEALGILKADDLKILERAFPGKNGKNSKEMRADAFGDYVVGKRERIPTPVQLIFQKISRFLERVKNALNGLGYRTAEDVFDDLFSGKLKQESGVRGVRQSELDGAHKAAYGTTEYSFLTDSLEAVERAIRGSQNTSKAALFATRAIDRAKEIAGRMGPLGALPEQNEYLAQRYRTLGNIDAGEELARKMHDALQKVSDEDAKAIYEFWTNPGMNVKQAGIKDVNAQKAALDVKKKIVDIGRELVERDLLDEKTYLENLGRYVPRVYLKHILGEQGFKAMGTGRKASVMAYLKQRKDIPEEVRRLLLGEIKDPAYLAARSISVPLRDMAILDWLGDIAKNGRWVLPESLVEWTFPDNGKTKKVTPYWLMSEAKRLREQIHHMPEADRAEAKALADRMQAEGETALAGIEGAVPDDYKQIPDSPRFGTLRGMYVRKEIYQDLIGSTTIFAGDASMAEKILGQGGVLTRYTQYWKWAKVAANPPAQVRNFVSNLILLHISGVPFHKVPTRIAQAIKEIRSNGKHWQIAKEYGVRKASFTNEEMARIERELIELESKRAGKGIGWPQMKSLAMKIVNISGDWYQFMEAVGKTAKIIDEMENGATAEDAAMKAHESLFDYSLVNPSVRYLRNAPIGIPFLTFLYKAVPMMAENFIKHPTRMIPYMALTYGLTQLVSSMTGLDDDDLEALKRALPVWLQDRNHTYFLPFKDAQGRWQAVDLGYFFPWTAVAEMVTQASSGEFGKLLQTSGLLGGPIPSLISAIQTNVDPFTKKPIVNTTATPAQQAGQIMGYLYQLNMPTWLTNQGVAGKVKQAMGGEVDKFGDPKATWSQVALRAGGVNLYAVEPTRSRARNIDMMETELKDLKREKSMELKNPNLSPKERLEIIKDYGKRIDAKKADITKYMNESRLSPKVLD